MQEYTAKQLLHNNEIMKNGLDHATDIVNSIVIKPSTDLFIQDEVKIPFGKWEQVQKTSVDTFEFISEMESYTKPEAERTLSFNLPIKIEKEVDEDLIRK